MSAGNATFKSLTHSCFQSVPVEYSLGFQPRKNHTIKRRKGNELYPKKIVRVDIDRENSPVKMVKSSFPQTVGKH